MERRLTDLVGDAIANLDPAPRRRLIVVVVIGADSDEVVVIAIAFDNDSTLPWHLANEANPIDVVALHQCRRPFEDEDERIGRSNIERVMERDSRYRTAVDNDLMTQCLGRLAVSLD